MSAWCGERETHGAHDSCLGWPPIAQTPCPSCGGHWYVNHKPDCPDYWTAARAAAPPVEPGCPECGLVGAHNPRCASRWHVPPPDRVAGLREAIMALPERTHLSGPAYAEANPQGFVSRKAVLALLAEPVPGPRCDFDCPVCANGDVTLSETPDA